MSENTIADISNQFADPRIPKVIEAGWFFEPYQAEVKELFFALGRADRYSNDPRRMLPYIEPKWIGEEHGNSTEKDQFEPAQIKAAKPILESMGLTKGILPPAGAHFQRAIDLGATFPTTVLRSSVTQYAVKELDVVIDEIDVWAGPRPRQPRDGTQQTILDFPGNDIRDNPWVRHTQARGDWDETNEWGQTEDTFARLAQLKVWGGNLLAHRINLGITDLEKPDQSVPHVLPGARVNIPQSYEYEAENGQRIVVINAPAVERKGPPRHTTESSAAHWLEHHAPPEKANVLFTSNNPHIVRTAMKVKHVFNQHGRGDIRLTVAGAPANPDASIQLFLGEVGAMIAFDVQQNYA